MTYVVNESCIKCKLMDCVEVCHVDCFYEERTALKRACLRRCRSPVDLITAYWRPGAAGALRTGLVHGAFCLGCCWFLMWLLFVGGIMNPFWVGGVALFIALEKLAPHGERLSRASGILLVIFGSSNTAVLVSPWAR